MKKTSKIAGVAVSALLLVGGASMASAKANQTGSTTTVPKSTTATTVKKTTPTTVKKTTPTTVNKKK